MINERSPATERGTHRADFGQTTELVSRKEPGEGESGAASTARKFTLLGVDPKHPYLAKRGISEETALTFCVGYFSGRGSMAGRVVIPIYNVAGELVAYAGHALDTSPEKYNFGRVPQITRTLQRAPGARAHLAG